VETELNALALDPESTDRDYILMVAGVGAGESAEQAARTLQSRGLNLAVQVVTFQLLRNEAGKRLLVREVEDGVGARAATATWTLEALYERADDYNVRQQFDQIRTDLTDQGFRISMKKHGLNFNLGSRLQCFWVRPMPGKIHVGYLAGNLPTIIGVEDSAAEQSAIEHALGRNWIDLDPDEARACLQTWSKYLITRRDARASELAAITMQVGAVRDGA
jgi:hypothetical protein